MKRFFKYLIILIIITSVIILGYYLLKKPSQSVLKKVPADVSFCLTVNKTQLLKDSEPLSNFAQDSLYIGIKSKFPAKALRLVKSIGFNALGDMAFFGNLKQLNLAWIGKDEQSMLDTIRVHKWPVSHFKDHDQVKIDSDLYLDYRWPIVLLSNYSQGVKNDFFGSSKPKIKKSELVNPETSDYSIYGFMIPEKLWPEIGNWLPIKQKAFVGLRNQDKKIELVYVQPNLKLKGKLGDTQSKPKVVACLNWPFTQQSLSSIKQMPDTVLNNLNRLVSLPFNNVYAEVLDTISSSQRRVTYVVDEEFKLTQKIIYVFETFPGMYLQFGKVQKSGSVYANNHFQPVNLGMDKLKLQYLQTPESFIITSDSLANIEHKQKEISRLPSYYLYVDFELLHNDPYWRMFSRNEFKTAKLYSKDLDKGSMFVIEFDKN